MTGPVLFDRDDMIAEIERELALRRRNYPRWITAGRMSPNTARRQIAVLEEIGRVIGALPGPARTLFPEPPTGGMSHAEIQRRDEKAT